MAAAAGRTPAGEFLLVPASASAAYSNGPILRTYAAMQSRIDALAGSYCAAGLGAGHRVAMLLENRPAYFEHWLALNSLTVSVVPINPDYRRAEIEYLLTHSEAVMAIGVRERLDDLRAAGAEAIDADEVAYGLPKISTPAGPSEPGLATECALMYTSGTTGQPKGCLLSNEYFLRSGLRYVNRRGHVHLKPGRSRVLTPLPMFHMNAMAGSTMGMILSGGCVIQLDRFHPKTWWRDVAESRATGIHCLGVMPAMLLGLPFTPDETAHCVEYGTAANVEPQHHEAFEKRFGFPLIEGWAMTETGSGGAISADTEPRHTGTRCFGRPPASVEVRLVDDAGNDVPEGEPGELLVRQAGPDPKRGFFSGYLKDPQATAAGWAVGWWHTGDMVQRWPDGTLHFADRKKNVIRRSGENISALEVEGVLRGHPLVAEVAVTGVPDEVRGEEVMACIVATKSAGAAEAREIFDVAFERTAYFKCPGWIAFVPSLPTTATQKLQRGAVRELGASLPGTAACFDLRPFKQRSKWVQKESA